MQLDAGVVKDEGVKFSVILSESGTYIPLCNVFQHYYYTCIDLYTVYVDFSEWPSACSMYSNVYSLYLSV